MVFFRSKTSKKIDAALKKAEVLQAAFASYMLILRQCCEDLQRIQVMDTASYQDVLLVFSKLKRDMSREEIVTIVSEAIDVLAANCHGVTHEAQLALSQIEQGCTEIAQLFESIQIEDSK